jgi:hypothetical protein
MACSHAIMAYAKFFITKIDQPMPGYVLVDMEEKDLF